jgi:hypothetical protein
MVLNISQRRALRPLCAPSALTWLEVKPEVKPELLDGGWPEVKHEVKPEEKPEVRLR